MKILCSKLFDVLQDVFVEWFIYYNYNTINFVANFIREWVPARQKINFMQPYCDSYININLS